MLFVSVITQTTNEDGQIVQQEQTQNVIIQGQQNVQVVQLAKGQQVQRVQEQRVQEQLAEPATPEARLQQLGGERLSESDTLLTPPDGEAPSEPLVSPKSRTPKVSRIIRVVAYSHECTSLPFTETSISLTEFELIVDFFQTRGVLVRGAPLGRVVRGGRGGVAARGLLTRGGGVKARGGRGGRGGRARPSEADDSLAREMAAALEKMSSTRKDSESEVSTAQQKTFQLNIFGVEFFTVGCIIFIFFSSFLNLKKIYFSIFSLCFKCSCFFPLWNHQSVPNFSCDKVRKVPLMRLHFQMVVSGHRNPLPPSDVIGKQKILL